MIRRRGLGLDQKIVVMARDLKINNQALDP